MTFMLSLVNPPGELQNLRVDLGTPNMVGK